ncbi:hypothetical protein NPIL_345161 [Nephila pilipes]|uniref:Uncharacterized protein n=1 Tax=Nephila pilipes TaxID=299642 RepID=A0A8X6NFV0_NEPPI|nr:hypothetical protein NPIL_345161 [Nephila pilipes]
MMRKKYRLLEIFPNSYPSTACSYFDISTSKLPLSRAIRMVVLSVPFCLRNWNLASVFYENREIQFILIFDGCFGNSHGIFLELETLKAGELADSLLTDSLFGDNQSELLLLASPSRGTKFLGRKVF